MEQNQLIIQFLERVVDENIKAAEKLSSVKFLQEEQRREVSEVLAMLRNGLKDDIKKHTSEESSKVRRDYEKLIEKIDPLFNEVKEHRKRFVRIDEVLTNIERRGMWFRGLVTIIVSISTIVGGFILLNRIVGWSQNQQENVIKQSN